MAGFQTSIGKHLMPRRHSALLTAIVAAFTVRPLIGDNGTAATIFSIAMLAVLVIGLYAIQVDELLGEQQTLVAERKRRNALGWVLALAAAAERLSMIFTPSRSLSLLGTVTWFLFFAFITWNELRAVLRQREITGETICMAISVYLLIGATWGLIYVVMYERQPHAFSFPPGTEVMSLRPVDQLAHIFSVLMYFSLSTLTTIGYGDITPVSLKARYAAVAEGVIGQFYMAILVARLVAMQMSRATERSFADRRENL